MRTPSGRRGSAEAARRAAGELESAVLATLWAAERPLTAGAVQAKLPDDRAYSTVVTILSRLYEKGVLTREKHGRAFAYTPVSDESGLAARRMRQVLDTRRDRGAVLARFVSELSEKDESVLRSLLGTDAPDRDAR